MLTHLHSAPVAPTRVVLLGANGFVPRALTTALQREKIPVLPLSSQELDLTDATAGARLADHLQATDTVIMTAALTPEKGRDPATLLKNLRMAEQVGLALTRQTCAHLVYVSSDAVYDARATEVNEDTPAAPGDLYGVMHLARELALGQVAAARQIPFCILRPCAIYGAGDTHNSYGPNRFVRTALAERTIRLFGAGEETRDHLSIDDLVALTLSTLQHRSTGKINLVGGQPVTFAELAAIISGLLASPVPIATAPRTGPITHRRFDLTQLQHAFPDHRPTRLATGLQATIKALAVAATT